MGERFSLDLSRLLLRCALEDIRSWRGPVAIAPDHAGDIAWARQLLVAQPRNGYPMKLVAQGRGNLGMRLERIDCALRGLHFRRRIYIGSDAPALTQRHYRRVNAGLGAHDVVLAGARDGGVTMMATRRRWPGLAALPWGGPGLADALSAACRQAGLGVLRFPGAFDVDRGADLSRLLRALRSDRRPARRELFAWLRRNGLD